MIGSMFRKAWFSDSATLNLDFTTGVLDSRLTFSRSTNPTNGSSFIGSNGLVQFVGADIPRFEFTTAGQPLGLLIESAATNIALHSSNLSGGTWQGDTSGGSLPAVSTVSQAAPDGSATVDRLVLNRGGGSFSRYRNSTVGTSGATYTTSVWLKANTANGGAPTQNVGLRLGNSSGIVCVATTTWQRFTHTFQLTNTNADLQLIQWTSIPGTDASVDILVWGAQIELGSFATSYMRTGAASSSRSADDVTMTGTDFSSWFSSAQGTMLAAFDRNTTSNTGLILSANDSTANERIDLAASTTGRFLITDGGSAQADIQPGVVTAGVSETIVGAYEVDNVNAALDAYLGTTDTSATLPTVDRLMIGRDSSASPVYLDGHISRVVYWPTRLTNDELRTLAWQQKVIQPNDALLTVSNFATIAEQSASALRFTRPLTDGNGFQHAAPGSTVSFVTTGRYIRFSIFWNDLVTRNESTSDLTNFYGVGSVMVNGSVLGTFARDIAYNATGTRTYSFTFANMGTKTVEIVWPYWSGAELVNVSVDAAASLSVDTSVPTNRLAVCGDSITQGAKVSAIDKTWAHRLAKLQGLQLLNLANGGAGAVGSHATTTLSGQTNVNTITYMIGYNNFVSQTALATFQAAVELWITNARAAQPSAAIHVISPIYSPNTNTITLAQYRSAVQAAELAVGDANTFYIDGLSIMTNNVSHLYDSVHPNDTGAAQIATNLAGII